MFPVCLSQIKSGKSETTGERRGRVGRLQAVFDAPRQAREPQDSPLVRHLFNERQLLVLPPPPPPPVPSGGLPVSGGTEDGGASRAGSSSSPSVALGGGGGASVAEAAGGRLSAGERARLFHTTYHAVPKMEVVKPEGIKW
jgi:hypothetical protein